MPRPFIGLTTFVDDWGLTAPRGPFVLQRVLEDQYAMAELFRGRYRT